MKLPSSLDANYVRLSTSSSDVQVLDIVNKASVAKDYNDSIRELNLRKAALVHEKVLRDHEADRLVSYARTSTCEHVQPEEFSRFLYYFVNTGKAHIAAVSRFSCT